MFTCMPGNVRALPIAKWQTGSEGRWDKTIPAEAALSLVGSTSSRTRRLREPRTICRRRGWPESESFGIQIWV